MDQRVLPVTKPRPRADAGMKYRVSVDDRRLKGRRRLNGLAVIHVSRRTEGVAEARGRRRRR
ncbi:hypothetical protein E2C01_004016 [Portunus trituberculatus]|uniref:Uncharacterized protein n=1 Tax=Portunus trituberculatus TaxID=210409 RepID=A0A5B7CQ88_PORTR|nr:hypothetical protein [Portunus trituberculatus]